jgi:hypothetical protein
VKETRRRGGSEGDPAARIDFVPNLKQLRGFIIPVEAIYKAHNDSGLLGPLVAWQGFLPRRRRAAEWEDVMDGGREEKQEEEEEQGGRWKIGP